MAALTNEVIDTEAAIRIVSRIDCGAVILFLGTTRDLFEQRQVVQLSYEAYAPMAISEMEKIEAEIFNRWQAHAQITHRLGEVPVGQISVAIAIAAPHRAEAYEASRYAIEALKSRVPIWKNEIYTDGSAWKENQ